jgi:hypothetical protein
LLYWIVTLVSVSGPALQIAPPLPLELNALSSVMLLIASDADAWTLNKRVVSPPVMVITPLPSMTVFCVIVFSLRTRIVFGPPQLKVTVPPPASAVVKAASVQLLGVPSPTTPAADATCAGPIAAANTISVISPAVR